MMSINFMFLSLMILSSIIAISSPSWFCMWLGIEMNTMSFIPILYMKKNKLSMESALKYFIIQAFASTIMFLALSTTEMNMLSMMFTSTIMTLAMSMKLGAAPFHMWYPPVAEGLLWSQNIMLMTWQKIAPMSIISMSNTNLITIMMTMSIMIGSINAFNQSSIRKLMAYSSISHMGWMFSSMTINSNTWTIYMLIYFITSAKMMSWLWLMNMYHTTQMFTMEKSYMPLMLLSLLSMSGFPPLLGFMGKWIVLNDLLSNNSILTSMLLILSSCINLYIYIRIIHPNIHLNTIKPKTKIYNSNIPMLISITTISSMFSIPIMLMM